MGEVMSSLRRRPLPPAAASPLEDDDLLSEILLRLPPQPSSLPRASAVSKQWRNLASDPRFCSRFRAHHRRNPPLLGCFLKDLNGFYFQPALEPPNRLPQACFSFPIAAGDWFLPLGCRHGLALILFLSEIQLLVWDPVAGEQHRLDIPRGFDREDNPISAAVFRAAGDIHHFQVALVGSCEKPATEAVASVYSSETGVWGNLISIPVPYQESWVYAFTPAVMIANSLYWLLHGKSEGILEFDLAKRSLALIPMPVPDTCTGNGKIWVMPAEGGGLGSLCLTGFYAQSWKRVTNCDGVGSWVPQRSIELDKLLSFNPETLCSPFILGFAEDNNMVLLWAYSRYNMKHCSSKNFLNPTSFLTVIHLKVSILQTRALIVGMMELNFCKIHNMICPDGHAIVMYRLSRYIAEFQWLGCRNGLLAACSSVSLCMLHSGL
ncbi:unnamed protein product [Alopecurus aequalis]